MGNGGGYIELHDYFYSNSKVKFWTVEKNEKIKPDWKPIPSSRSCSWGLDKKDSFLQVTSCIFSVILFKGLVYLNICSAEKKLQFNYCHKPLQAFEWQFLKKSLPQYAVKTFSSIFSNFTMHCTSTYCTWFLFVTKDYV